MTLNHLGITAETTIDVSRSWVFLLHVLLVLSGLYFVAMSAQGVASQSPISATPIASPTGVSGQSQSTTPGNQGTSPQNALLGIHNALAPIGELLLRLGVTLGVVFGAFLGYLFTQHLQHRQTAARRDLLLRTLRCELEDIARDSIQPFSSEHALIASTLHPSALPQLLEGGTIDPKRQDVVTLLLELQVAITKYNDLVPVMNLAVIWHATGRGVPVDIRQQMHDIMKDRHDEVMDKTQDVLRVLAAEGHYIIIENKALTCTPAAGAQAATESDSPSG